MTLPSSSDRPRHPRRRLVDDGTYSHLIMADQGAKFPGAVTVPTRRRRDGRRPRTVDRSWRRILGGCPLPGGPPRGRGTWLSARPGTARGRAGATGATSEPAVPPSRIRRHVERRRLTEMATCVLWHPPGLVDVVRAPSAVRRAAGAQCLSGAVSQWCSASVVQCLSGAVPQWCSVSVVQCLSGARAAAGAKRPGRSSSRPPPAGPAPTVPRGSPPAEPDRTMARSGPSGRP